MIQAVNMSPPVPLQSPEASRPAAALRVEAAQAAPAQTQALPQEAVSVELSPAAQARLLKSEGYNLSEISLKLKTDELLVKSYLDYLA
jgi:hypothetical protein